MTDGVILTNADAEADAKGEPRPDNPNVPPPPPPTPPGTVATSFIESSGFKAAVAAWLAVGLIYAKGLILHQPVSPDAIALGVEMAVWTTAAAFGIHREGASLRYR